ncbi:mitotic fidelity of chromosome transmission-related protein [Lecanora helva]
MGPRRTPHKQREPGNYEAVGQVGRRTGATLKDTGVRDEHGFEPIPSFSSPTKSLFQSDGLVNDATNSAEDSMEIDQTTIEELTDILQSTPRRSRISLPPKATSPIKTHLNSSPRRSMAQSVGPLSSPSRDSNNGTPTRSTSHPPTTRSAEMLRKLPSDSIRESVEKSPGKVSLSKTKRGRPVPSQEKVKKKAFDLTELSNGHNVPEVETSNIEDLPNGVMHDDDSIIPATNDTPMANSTFDHESLEADQTRDQPQAHEPEPSELMAPPATTGTKDSSIGSKRGPQSEVAHQDESQAPGAETREKRRGRPPKKTPVYQDPEANVPAPTSLGAKTKRPPPPSERDPNIRTKLKKTTKEKAPSRTGSVAAGPRYVQRSETPANDSGALITRFGRQSIKPLATWRGEKTVMGDRTVDTLPGIKEVIRVDEIVEPRPKQRYRKARPRARSRLQEVEEEEEEPEEGKAAWELDPGIMVAKVLEWDAENNKFNEEDTRDEDVAYSHEAIQMRDIKGADFKFAKTLTLDFFGSGMVELPPGGAKRIKNSRKMQMVFFVFYGRVTVSVGTPPTKFSIGKGGQWQVPRGNFYAITNESDTKDARIFFAQGCEVQAGAVDESAMA